MSSEEPGICEKAILGTIFQFSDRDAPALEYIDDFLGAYDLSEPGIVDHLKGKRYTVTICGEDRDFSSATGEAIAVHRTKHAYWTFDGILHDSSTRTVTWPEKRVEIRLDTADIEFRYASDLTSAAAGEALFHALRGIALAERESDPMLHAAVADISGHGVAFAGDALAGKTTLFTQAVLRCRARPVTNDRVVLKSEAGRIKAVSWPSYCSYCEGTLLSYPALAEAALAYESDDCRYRTQRWPNPLEFSFYKDRKRIYPMRWFSDASNTKYQMSTVLSAIILPRLLTENANQSVRLEPLTPCAASKRLTELAFVGDDVSFRPWHGLQRNREADQSALAACLSSRASKELSVFQLDVPVTRLLELGQILDHILNDL